MKPFTNLIEAGESSAIYNMKDTVNRLVAVYKAIERSDIPKKSKLLKQIKKMLAVGVDVDHELTKDVNVPSIKSHYR